MPFPVDETFILKAEGALGVRFPDSYRRRMMSVNGGEIEVDGDVFTLYPFLDSSDRKRLKRTTNSNVRETMTARNHYGLADDLIALGDNGGGDLLVYRVAADGQVDPAVFFLNHENHDLNLVAADFSDLADERR